MRYVYIVLTYSLVANSFKIYLHNFIKINIELMSRYMIIIIIINNFNSCAAINVKYIY